MLDVLKGFIKDVVKEIDEQGTWIISEDNFWKNENEIVYEDIMKEIRQIINNGTLLPFNKIRNLANENYYLFNINVGDGPERFTILYKDDDKIDILWIFGFGSEDATSTSIDLSPCVICVEFEALYNTNRTSVYEGSYICRGWEDRFLTLMSSFFEYIDMPLL